MLSQMTALFHLVFNLEKLRGKNCIFVKLYNLMPHCCDWVDRPVCWEQGGHLRRTHEQVIKQ